MRIFFTTGIHGSDQCFRKFINAGTFYEADVLILGCDMHAVAARHDALARARTISKPSPRRPDAQARARAISKPSPRGHTLWSWRAGGHGRSIRA